MRARVIKIILTVGLLIGLGTLLDWGLVFRTIVQARLEWIAVAALCVALARMVIAWRWQTILRSTGQRYGFGALVARCLGGDRVGIAFADVGRPGSGTGRAFAYRFSKG